MNTSYSQPWGWSRARWDAFVINSMTGLEASPVRALKETFAWCVFVAILSTAAMAVLSESEASS